MIDINREIRSLLFEHDYVTVPEFGAFIAHYQPSTYRAESNTFSPPNRNISFNSVLKQDDGLLTTAVIKKMAVSFNKAKEIISSFVKEMKQALISNGMYSIPGVGTLELTDSDNIVFEPISLNFFSESYGFETLYSFSNSNYTYDRKFYSDIYTTPNQGSSVESMEINFPFEKSRKPLYARLLYVTPVAALLVGLLTIVMVNPNNLERANSSLYPGDYVASVKGWFDQPRAEPNVTVPSNVENAAGQMPVAPQSSVLVGVFKDTGKAYRLYNMLVLNDLNPVIVDSAARKTVAVPVSGDQEAKQVSDKLEQLFGQRGVLIKK